MQPIKPESTSDSEPAVSRVEYAIGFSTLAAFIASDTDLVTFRRFNCLSARNLLYLQAELAMGERILPRCCGVHARKLHMHV